MFLWGGRDAVYKNSSLPYPTEVTKRERDIQTKSKFFSWLKMNYGWTILIWVAVGLYVFWFLDKVDKKPKRKRRSKKK